jgi:hypothetical protein
MSKSTLPNVAESPEPWVEIIRQKLASMRFGSIQLVVHEGRVTQVESLERTRIQADPASTTVK